MTQKVPRPDLAFSALFIATGVLLLMINLIGRFHYTTIDAGSDHLMDDIPRSVTEQEFWRNAFQREAESLEEYLDRFTELVGKRMLRIDSRYTQPTFFENWILWLYAKNLTHYEWSDTERAVRLGGGYCSQNAIVFNNVLRDQDINSRIIQLGGHVLNEVLVNGKWRVYDSDFRVVFHASLRELEQRPERVYEAYLRAGRSASEAENWKKIFASDADNWHYKKTRLYREEKYVIEVAALYLIWILPVVLIFMGLRKLPMKRDCERNDS